MTLSILNPSNMLYYITIINGSNMSEKIIFFDGVCNLCNGFINFLFKYNQNPTIKVASIQGETATKFLNESERVELATVIYQRNGHKYYRSGAVLRVLLDMGFPFNSTFIFILIPSFIRDSIYLLIAKNRYKLFGEKDTCRLPTPEEKERFLP